MARLIRWRHDMETHSELRAFWDGNPSVIVGSSHIRPVMQSFVIFFVVSPNKL